QYAVFSSVSVLQSEATGTLIPLGCCFLKIWMFFVLKLFCFHLHSRMIRPLIITLYIQFYYL
ncbi:MAG TPA: hypothetical protein PKA14_19540, partial [Leptospiraceae bacterium]|nr:hypothetical protein [Leptospiraceae bacterium]